jgi:hypothetical protein
MVELKSLDVLRFRWDQEYAHPSIPASGNGTSRLQPQVAARVDESDRTVARYLVRRLGAEAGGYAKRAAWWLAGEGQPDKAAAWSAIAEAIAEAEGQAAAEELRLKAAQCRRLADGITSMADPTRARLLALAAELERQAAAALHPRPTRENGRA